MNERCIIAGSDHVCYSDHGSQHGNNEYAERRAEIGIELYVGSFGGSYGKALTKLVAGLLQAEVIHRCGAWSFKAIEQATLV